MRKVLLLAAALSLAGAGQALAHARLLHSTPNHGETAHGSPKVLRLAFSETIEPTKSNVTVAGPAGPVALGPLALDAKDKRVVVLPVSAPLRPGVYHVSWGMTSADGHHTDGTYDFKVAP